jgi:hypothetical protein
VENMKRNPTSERSSFSCMSIIFIVPGFHPVTGVNSRRRPRPHRETRVSGPVHSVLRPLEVVGEVEVGGTYVLGIELVAICVVCGDRGTDIRTILPEAVDSGSSGSTGGVGGWSRWGTRAGAAAGIGASRGDRSGLTAGVGGRGEGTCNAIVQRVGGCGGGACSAALDDTGICLTTRVCNRSAGSAIASRESGSGGRTRTTALVSAGGGLIAGVRSRGAGGTNIRRVRWDGHDGTAIDADTIFTTIVCARARLATRVGSRGA